MIDNETIIVPSGTVRMGALDFYAEEAPLREVPVESFKMDRTPVTNRNFARFIEDTDYVTVAERSLDPDDYPSLDPLRLCPGALVFIPPKSRTAAVDVYSWWHYVPGASWRRPEATKTVFAGRLDHPVTCVAYTDAAAYAAWAGKRLPTEAEWEWAARGGLVGATYAWGDTWMPDGRPMANIWQGIFPSQDLRPKGSYRTTKVGSFPANGLGLSDMIGNVWEWTQSWYLFGDAAGLSPACCTPPRASYDPEQPDIEIPHRVLKGGSFLCAPNYCARYRPAARQPQMIDTASVHIGFRCAADIDS